MRELKIERHKAGEFKFTIYGDDIKHFTGSYSHNHTLASAITHFKKYNKVYTNKFIIEYN